MKPNFEKLHKTMAKHDRLYGTTTMGSRGQVVIPAQARKDLKLKPGDQLLVMGKFNKALGLMKADQLESFVETIMNNLSGSGHEQFVKERFKNFFANK